MARALILGATGHLGAHIVHALLKDGHDVRAAYRRAEFLPILDGLSIERVHVDLDQPTELREALSGCEWVFHAAAYSPRAGASRKDALERGLASTRRVLDTILRATPSRVVFTSSAATIRHVAGRSATELDAEPWPLAQPRSWYATVKIAIEHEVLNAHRAGLPVVIVNPGVCIGEYDAHRFSGRLILAFATRRLPWYLDYHFNAIDTADVGIGHVRAATHGQLGERYLLTHQQLTLKEFATLVARAAGVASPCRRIPYPVVLAAASVSESWGWLTRTEPLPPRSAVQMARVGQQLDGTKAIRDLSLPQTPMEEAIQRAVAWFKQCGYL